LSNPSFNVPAPIDFATPDAVQPTLSTFQCLFIFPILGLF